MDAICLSENGHTTRWRMQRRFSYDIEVHLAHVKCARLPDLTLNKYH